MDLSTELHSADDMFRPPVNRAMRVLDRSFFYKKIPLSAAKVFENTKISQIRGELTKSKDILFLDRYANVKLDDSEPVELKKRCVLLKPEIKYDGMYARCVDSWPVR
jgi:tRNA (guanine37-N1)-methyltransferase